MVARGGPNHRRADFHLHAKFAADKCTSSNQIPIMFGFTLSQVAVFNWAGRFFVHLTASTRPVMVSIGRSNGVASAEVHHEQHSQHQWQNRYGRGR